MFKTMQLHLGTTPSLFAALSSLNFCPLNLLLVKSHQTEIIIVKRFVEGRDYVTRVRVEPRSCNQGRRKDGTFALSATLLFEKAA